MERARVGCVALLIATGGGAALGWEVIWQLRASIALGVSAFGTALTLGVTMFGMAIGSTLAGRRWVNRSDPMRLYGWLELSIGICGIALGALFQGIELLDATVHASFPTIAPFVHVISIAAAIGPAALAMGASVPAFHAIARDHGVSLAFLYGANTAGASLGVLLISFVLLPALGVFASSVVLASINLGVFLFCRVLSRNDRPATTADSAHPGEKSIEALPLIVVFSTGFIVFGLEVAWFRALRAVLQSTTESFSLMLAAVLAPLALGAGLAQWMRRRSVAPGGILALAGCFVWLVTPVFERLDQFPFAAATHTGLVIQMFLACLALLGPVMLLLGTPLPWYLDASCSPRHSARLYTANLLGAVAGSLCSAWILLPAFGTTRAAWLFGALAVGAALLAGIRRYRVWLFPAAAVSLSVAIFATSSLGRDRILTSSRLVPPVRVLAYDDGPDSTVSVVEDRRGRALVIDGFVATREAASGGYMRWMGHLPMLLHASPERALVIAFGTGQTANAVRRENPRHLDIAELDATVLSFAHFFDSNEDVLLDERVQALVMDGRAWLRRAEQTYDVITLEPMPPHFAGMNALYSSEFYAILAERLAPGGIAAQWAPLHLLPTPFFISVVASFQQAFPDAALWIDPVSGTGILLGRRAQEGRDPLGSSWPGLVARPRVSRALSGAAIRSGLVLGSPEMAELARFGEPITDDNQLLAYGGVRRWLGGGGNRAALQNNRELIERIALDAKRRP